MNKKDLEQLERQLQEEVVTRRKLGGFDANAGTILKLTEWMYEIARHLREKTPAK